MFIVLLVVSLFVLVVAYRFYGRFLCRRCQVTDDNKTPAVTENDGVDFLPTSAPILFGHHFSSIAGAGPIVGPILACMYFGWAPTWVWILVGAVLIGGVHDFGSLLMSLRNRGRSITEITHRVIGPRTAFYFRLFLLLALIYVIIVFLDITSLAFTHQPQVATASSWFVICAVGFGLVLRWKGLPWLATMAIFVPLTFAGLAIGHYFPMSISGEHAKTIWLLLIVGYCYVAAVLPVNVLLQPRDFLSSIFLYSMMLLGLLGLLFCNQPIQAPAFHGFTTDKVNPGFLFPVLFITVACGACSGFHSLVASGTTSKQVTRESDARPVAYGAMLVEGLLAIFALASIAVLSAGDIEGKDPVKIFSSGAAVFMGALGIPTSIGAEFTALTVSTFLLTTLDTCTRLTRFLIQEMFNWTGASARYLGTAAVLVIPAMVAPQTFEGLPAWKALWPIFGATNQMMAGLALVTFVVYLKDRQIAYKFVLIPAYLMMLSPLVALFFMAIKLDWQDNWLLPLLSIGMFFIGLYVAGKSLKYVFSPLPNKGAPVVETS